jgi:hypothetical protein
MEPVPPSLVWAHVSPSRASSFHTASLVKIGTPEKAFGQFKFRKVPETSKYTKHCRVITKIRGIDGKSP